MKRLIISWLGLLSAAMTAFSQGAVEVGISSSALYGLAVNQAGNYYSGAYGAELWMLNGATVPSGINTATNSVAYNSLASAGFTQVKTWSGKTISSLQAGVFVLGEVDLPAVSPAGGKAVVALAFWTGSSSSWSAAVASGAKGGVVAFATTTVNYNATPPPIPPDLTAGWNAFGEDLVMTPLGTAPANPAPSLTPIPNQAVAANTTLTLTASVQAGSAPGQTLTYSVGAGAPEGASITANGLFTWTPTSAQAPSTNPITIIVTTGSTPPLSDSETFTVVVQAANSTPVLASIANQTIFANALFSYKVSATDTDRPSPTLTFSLGSGAPTGAAITANGLLTWTPTLAQAPSTNSITVVVTAAVTPPLSANQTFTVVVLKPIAQGAVDLDNWSATNGVAISRAGDYYSGTFGAELWVLNGITVPANIDSSTNTAAYANLAADGFALAQTWNGQAMAANDPGTLSLGGVELPMVQPSGSPAVLALAVWTGNYTNWTAAAAAGAQGGVIAFVNGTANTSLTPPPVPPDLVAGWDAFGRDLVMTQLAPQPARTPPVLQPIADRTAYANTLLSFTATATDASVPVSSLTFSLDSGAPAGAAITAAGLFTWTPTAAQAPSTNLVTIRVSDNGAPPIATSQTFTVVVIPASAPPTLASIPSQTIVANSLLSLQASATDTNPGPQTLTFSLGAGAPSGAAITAAGLFTWTPTLAQAPSSNLITIEVTANTTPPLSATQSFTVVVIRPNQPPVLASIPNQMIFANALFSYKASATDTDVPPQTLTFSLSSGAPAGAAITANGLFTWTPTLLQALTTNVVSIKVTDNGTPPLSASQSFTVTVLKPLTQGAVDVDNWSAANGVAISRAGDYYSGAFGMELWVLNGTSVPANINSATNSVAYASLAGDGFTLAQTWKMQTMAGNDPGTLSLGGLDLPMVKPPGSPAVLALAVWAGNFTNWTAAAAAGAQGGVIAFVNATVDPSLTPPPVPPDLVAGWNSFGRDLVMTPIPSRPLNTPPVLAPIPNQVVYAKSLFSYKVSATDTDQPPQTLTFSLGPGAPAGAAITGNGLLTWTPALAQASSTNLITVEVADNGTPSLSATQTFSVVVLKPLAQGAVDVDNWSAVYGVALDRAGSYYSGAFGMELWVLNGTTVPNGVNSATNVVAYGSLAADGFTLAQTWSQQTMAEDEAGTLSLGGVELPMVKPAGSPAVLALAVWTGNYANWTAAVAGGAKGGVAAFVNATVDPSLTPPPVPPDLAAGWDTFGEDLVMTLLAPLPVNTAPVFAPIANQTVSANSLLSFQASATDTDRPPQTLTYNLAAGAPAGAAITADGLFTWTPTSAQAPSTNLITVTVTDNGAPPLSESQTLTVVVYQPNTPPVLVPIANQTVYANTLLSFKASATDTDRPPQTLTYSLAPGAPAGAAITAGGLFTWTPSLSLEDTTNSFTIKVTDNGAPPLSASQTFTVAVLKPFTPGAVDVDNVSSAYGVAIDQPGQYYSGTFGMELWVLNDTNLPGDINSATNSVAYGDLAADGFVLAGSWNLQSMNVVEPGSFSLGGVELPMVKPPGSPAVLALAVWTGNATNWAAAGAAGAKGGVVAFVNATVNPSLTPPPVPPDLVAGWKTSGRDLVLTPIEVPPRTAPVLIPPASQTATVGRLLSLQISATDASQPPQTLTFTLGPGAPAGASITAGGLFTWTPTAAEAYNRYYVTIDVSDGANPPLSDSRSFAVTVDPAVPTALDVDNEQAQFGIALDEPGNYYTGAYGLELWVLNDKTVPTNLNSVTNVAAYANLPTDGFTLAMAWSSQTMTPAFAGTLILGGIPLSMVQPAGSTAVLALVAWTGDYTNWTSAAAAGAKGGVVAFANATANTTLSPPPTPPDLAMGWNSLGQDLVLTPLVAVTTPTTQTLNGVAQDGYLGGATVFFDANFNGIQDSNEPSTLTDGQGHFNLAVDVSLFDSNHNGQLDPQEGRLVVLNGLDIATGLPLSTPMIAPVGSTVINPLTTLMETVLEQNPGLASAQAQTAVQQALGISTSVDLTHYDPLAASGTNDAAATPVLKAAAAVQDTVVQAAALLTGANTSLGQAQAAAAVVDALAARAQTGGALNLSQPAAVSSILTGAGTATGTQLPGDLTAGAATVIAGANQLADTLVAEAANSGQAAAQIAQVQFVAQGAAAQFLGDAGAGSQSIDDVVVAFSGPALGQAVTNAPVGNVTGNEVGTGSFAFSRAAFRVNEDGGPVPGAQVSINRTGGSQGAVTVLVTLRDGTATAAAGDYRPGTITVAFANGEISKTVDLSASLIDNPALQGEPTINLALTLAAGAPAGASLGSQTNAVVAIVNSNFPGSFSFSAGQYQVQRDGTANVPVVVTRSGGSKGAVTLVVTPSAIAGGAVAGVDFLATPIPVAFQDGDLNQLVSVPVLATGSSGPDAAFEMTLGLGAGAPAGAAIGSPATAQVVIEGTGQGLPQIRIVSVSRPAAGQCHIRFEGVSGQKYALEGSSDLRNWTTLSSGVMTAGTNDVVDSVGGQPRRFYRLQLLQ